MEQNIASTSSKIEMVRLDAFSEEEGEWQKTKKME